VGADPKGANNPKVKLRGLPYGSTVTDVLNFFRGFGVIEGSVTFGVNAEGRPSGEAWVSFNRLEDARRAVREKDRHHMVRILELV
jgi:heterogeneous nuclear ribonucleoprotein F/H